MRSVELKTRVLKPSEAALNEAAALIREGRLVGLPTETVYGLGANALNPEAVRDIFEAKGRPSDNPLIVHISRMEELEPLIAAAPSPEALKLAQAYWPGPLTMIFPRSEIVPLRTTGGLETVAVRMPSHPVAREVIRRAGVPVAAPSGNRSGRPSPTSAAHMLEDMDGRIPLILDGGESDVGVESTVLDMTGEKPRILRPGGVTLEMIARVCGTCEVDSAVMRPLKEDEKPRSPGMKYRHYAPQGQLTIYRGQSDRVIEAICETYDQAERDGRRPLILALEGSIDRYGERRRESLGQDASGMAHVVFSVLRDADALGADVILSEAVEAEGIGLAVMNRLGRAAAFHIVEVE